jgi:hypothetical protein
MTALACLALLALAYAWHRLRCKRCTTREQVRRKAVLSALERAHKTVRGRL